VAVARKQRIGEKVGQMELRTLREGVGASDKSAALLDLDPLIYEMNC
jgi:hypothetical protein